MIRNSFVLALTTAAVAGFAPAQDRLPPITKSLYSPTVSWGLFAACDRNSDDKLDLIEAAAALDSIALDKRDAFRLLDLDRDGNLQWSEFDALFRETIESSNSFKITPARVFREPIDPAAPRGPKSRELALIELVDKDQDGQLSPQEFRRFVRQADLATQPPFAAVDRDQSGQISPREFAAVLALLPDGGQTMLKDHADSPTTLPIEYRAADRDNTGSLSEEELQLALIAIDPSLERWSQRIFEDVDKNGNHDLVRTELQQAVAAGAARQQ
ncbi:MAG: EF-hand domain-containing protein [Planctomycetes bacterium]|nr:EF-hand domain-containing protein [Planctomycetota bacterium]